MRIIAFVNSNSGPAYHRVIMPLMLMKDVDVFITNNLLEQQFEKGCELFIYNRILPEHALPGLAKLKQKYGFKICVDIDDHWELDDHHILYDLYQQVEFAKSQIEQIISADFVTTTHHRLATEIVQHNTNVHIIPNAIPRQGQFDIERIASHLTRLFWQGSITHREDIELLSGPIRAIGPLAPKVKMVMAGYTLDEPEWEVMARTYTADLKHQYKLIPGEPVVSYYQAYQHADICLVPLLNTKFNRMKSNLKVLEAANLGLPVIASHVHPYLDMPLLYCKSGTDWETHIKRLIGSKNRQKEAGQKLREFCFVNYNFDKINRERKQIFEFETQLNETRK